MARERLGELVLEALRASGDGFAVYLPRRDAAGEVAGFRAEVLNESMARWMGRSVEDCAGADLVDLDPAAVENGRLALMAAALADGEPRKLRSGLPDSGLTLECVMTRLLTADGERVVVATRDVSELVAGERLLAAAYEMTAEVRATLQTALDATSDAFAVYDVVRDDDGRLTGLRLVMINMAGALPLADGDPEALVGRDLRDFFPDSVHNGLWDAIGTAMERQVTSAFRVKEMVPSTGSPTGLGAGGPPTLHAWDNTIAPVGEERVVITWRDVTGEVLRERELERAHHDAHYAATHDPLTGLANRSLLLEKLTEALWSSGEDERVGVAYVDLDGFKGINDRLGHAVGDELLQAVAGRLLRIVRQGDTVARIGGDEFVLVLRRLPRDWDEKGFVERAQVAMEEPLLLAGGTVQPRASYGLVVSPPAPRDLDRLMKLADQEMYERKQVRKGGPQTRNRDLAPVAQGGGGAPGPAQGS